MFGYLVWLLLSSTHTNAYILRLYVAYDYLLLV